MDLLTNITTPLRLYVENYFSQSIKEVHITDKYCWIPTNLGILNFDYILFNKEKLKKIFPNSTFKLYSNDYYPKILNINDLYIDDFTLPKNFKILKSFFNFNFEIKIKNDENNDLIGKVTLQSIENSKYKNLLIILKKYFKIQPLYEDYLIYSSANFIINKNGKFILNNIKINFDKQKVNFKNSEDILFNETIPLAIYTTIKKIVHGDNHHEQKIDTTLKIYNKFDYMELLKDFSKQVKEMEKFVKDQVLFNKNGKFLIPKVKNNTKGYIAYINTFFHLFKDEVKDKKGFNTLFINIHNVKKSLDASTDRYLDKKNSNKGLITFFLTLIAIFLSFNIAYNSFGINKTSIFINNFENLNNNIATFLNIITGSIFNQNIITGRDIFIITLLIVSFWFAYIYEKDRINYYIENVKKNYFSSLTEYSRFNKLAKYILSTFTSLILIFFGIKLFL